MVVGEESVSCEFTDAAYQSQLADHQRSTTVQSIRNNVKSTELQLCDNLAAKRKLVNYSTQC